MATITLRSVKGSALTFAEGDANFSNLNNDKIELTDLSVSTDPASGGGSLSYNNTSGAFTFAPADTSSFLTSASSVGTLSDVDLTNNTNGYVLTYNSSSGNLELQSAAGGASELNDLSDVSYSGLSINDGDILVWSSLNSYFTNGTIDITKDTMPELGGNLSGAGYKVEDVELDNYKETIYSLGTTDSPSIDVANGNVQSVSISSGLALPAFSNAETGQSVTLLVAGSGTATGTANHKFSGGTATLTNYSVVSIFYDGTTYWTSIATDFQ